MKPYLVILAVVSSFLLNSCETTGDPAAGGFFGWSEEKSNQRIYSKEQEYYDIKADTDRQNSRARSYESQY